MPHYPGQRFFENPFHGSGPVDISSSLFKARVLSCVDLISNNLKPTVDNGEGGLYVGTAGIAYMFYYLAKGGNFPDRKTDFLQSAKAYVTSAVEYYEAKARSSSRKKVAFLLGNGGVYAVAALIHNLLGEFRSRDQFIEKYKQLAAVCEPVNFLDNGSDEIFVGRAGYLMGLLLMERDLGSEVVPRDQVLTLCRRVMESGSRFRQRLQFDGDIPIMFAYHGTLYLGAAHGIAGIIQVLLSIPDFLDQDPVSAAALWKSVDYMLHHCVQRGNMASNLEGALRSSQSHAKFLVHWCHGAAGVVYMFARTYLAFGKEERYLNVCRDLADTVWEQGLLRKGPGICHGVAGSGYVFLLLYRLTGESKYLYRAEKFASFIFTEQFRDETRTPDRPFSLFEGWAGTVCFLNDLLSPRKAEFPLSDVFYNT